MATDPPTWLKDIVNNNPPVKPRQTLLSKGQFFILAALALVFCAICGGTGVVFLLNRGTLLAQATVPVTNPTPPQTATSGPTATPAATATPRPTATSMLPQASATLLPTATATYAVAPEFVNKDKIKDITQFVEQWRELSLPQNIPIVFLTRSQLREQWSQEAYDAETLDVVRTQQEFYKALGLLAPEIDLFDAAFDTQAGMMMGYYTSEEKNMVIIADSVNMFANEEMTFAHEYTHALQDHHFDLSRILVDGLSADALLAARSLPEGDAQLVEDLFTSQNISRDQLDYSVYRYLFNNPPATIDGVSPALNIFTFFPYTAGEYFAVYLYITGDYSWKLVNQAYNYPPASTEQVMHPEKYLAGEIPTAVQLPNFTPALGPEWHELDRDVLGEAGFLVWLIDQVEDQTAIDAAAGWDGDTYSLWVDDTGQRIVIESSVWETSRDAAEFVHAFNLYVTERESVYHQFNEADVTFFEYNGGAILLKQTGRNVLLIIAPNRTLLYSVHNQF